MDRRFTQQNASTSTILLSSQKRFPHAKDPHRHPNIHTPTCTPIHQDSSMHHPLRHIHPALLSPPSSFPPSSFSQGATSHALGKQTSTEQLQKPSMKSKLFGNKTPLHTGTPPPQNRTPACTTLSQTYPPHPSFTPFLLSAFLLFLKAPLPMLLASRHQQSSFKNLQ